MGLMLGSRRLAQAALWAPSGSRRHGQAPLGGRGRAAFSAEGGAAEAGDPGLRAAPCDAAGRELGGPVGAAKPLAPPTGPGLADSATLRAEESERRPSLQKALQEVEEKRASQVVFPPPDLVFRAFLATPLDKVRVVIVGQDPYHGRGQAMGLSFSVPRGAAVPPSLQNMLREANAWPAPHGDLTSWTEQGVLLLNSVLSVAQGQPNSHKGLGWERLTDAAIRAINKERQDVIFLLWGKDAQSKASLVDGSHVVLIAGHPSPYSYERHFKGCGHFQKVNELLTARGEAPIRWSLD
ncbi:unnamed protein product [Effrenium voratum]|nr:unnamed protein product [Effrenium voratum]